MSSYAKASEDKLSFICPKSYLMGSICLPCTVSAFRRILDEQSLKRYYTWHFSMQGLPANDVTIKSCGLLPHIFNLTPTLSWRRGSKGSYFLWHSLLFQLTFQHWLKYPAIHRCIALYCPDFPPNWKRWAIARFAANSKNTCLLENDRLKKY